MLIEAILDQGRYPSSILLCVGPQKGIQAYMGGPRAEKLVFYDVFKTMDCRGLQSGIWTYIYIYIYISEVGGSEFALVAAPQTGKSISISIRSCVWARRSCAGA